MDEIEFDEQWGECVVLEALMREWHVDWRACEEWTDEQFNVMVMALVECRRRDQVRDARAAEDRELAAEGKRRVKLGSL